MKISVNKKLLAVLAAGSLALAGCSTDEAKDTVADATSSASSAVSEASSTASEKVEASKASLSDWDGSYVSLATYVDSPELEEAYKEHADKSGKSVDDIKSELKEFYDTGFDGLVVDGDTITFVKDKDELGNPSESPSEYTFLESVDGSHNGKDFTWYIFEATGDAESKYAVLLPLHGEESLEHFHARFGDDKDELLARENFPTFVNPETATDAQVQEEILEHLD